MVYQPLAKVTSALIAVLFTAFINMQTKNKYGNW
jgi:hypothetical protein